MFCVFCNLTTPHNVRLRLLRLWLYTYICYLFIPKKISHWKQLRCCMHLLHLTSWAFSCSKCLLCSMFDIIISFYVWLSWMIFGCLQIFLISDHNIQHSNKCKKPPISHDVKIYIDNYSWWTFVYNWNKWCKFNDSNQHMNYGKWQHKIIYGKH